MNLRELIIERIFYAVDEQTLISEYGVFEDELENMNDLDLFELFEDVMGILAD
jgi:hypothetical protein